MWSPGCREASFSAFSRNPSTTGFTKPGRDFSVLNCASEYGLSARTLSPGSGLGGGARLIGSCRENIRENGPVSDYRRRPHLQGLIGARVPPWRPIRGFRQGLPSGRRCPDPIAVLRPGHPEAKPNFSRGSVGAGSHLTPGDRRRPRRPLHSQSPILRSLGRVRLG